MKEILKYVSYADYEDFKKRVLEESEWTLNIFRNKKYGKTKTTKLELRGLWSIVNDMYGNDNKVIKNYETESIHGV